MTRVAHGGAPAALGLLALLALGLGLAVGAGVGVELRCGPTTCSVASGALLAAPVAFRFTRAEVQWVRDDGAVSRPRPGARIVCSFPVLVSSNGAQRPLLPREVCPAWTALDLVALRQWVTGSRTSLRVVDWVVGVHAGPFLGILLGLAWALGHMLGAERITVDPRDGLRVVRGGFSSRVDLLLPIAAITRTVGLRPRASPAAPSALPTGHLYVEARDGRWHLVTRHRALAEPTLAALQALGLPHQVASDAEVTARASAVLLRALVGSALWTVVFLATCAGAVALAFDRIVPSLP